MLFSRQPGPSEVEEALYTTVYSIMTKHRLKILVLILIRRFTQQTLPFASVLKVYSFPEQVIPAVLQQELILYCGKLIATNPELFSGILKVRMR